MAAYGLVALTALAVGYFLTSPLELTSFAGLLAVGSVLFLPLLLRWHHLLLVTSWNCAVVVFFLPGQPDLWMLMTLINQIIDQGRVIHRGDIILSGPLGGVQSGEKGNYTAEFGALGSVAFTLE